MNNRKFYGWNVVISMFAMMFLIYPAVINGVSTFSSTVASDLNLNLVDYLLFFSISSLTIGLFSPFVGKLSNRFKPKFLMALGVFLVALSLIGFSFSSELIHFYLLAIGQGVGFALSCQILPSVLVNNWFNENRGLAMGITFAATGVGGAFYAPLIGRVILNYGWRKAYWLIAALMIFLIIPLVLKFAEEKPSDRGLEPMGGVPDHKEVAKGASLSQTIKSFSFWLFGLSLIAISIVTNGFLLNFTSYLLSIGKTPQSSNLLLSSSLFFITVGKVVLGRVYDKIGIRKTLVFVFIIGLIFTVAALNSHILLVALFTTIVFGLYSGNLLLSSAELTTYLFGDKRYAEKYSNVMIFISGGGFLAPLFTKIFEKGEAVNYLGLFMGYGVCALVAFVSQMLALKTRPYKG